MGWHRIVRQVTYPDGTVVEPGDVVDTVPDPDVAWLLEAGAIETAPEPETPEPPKAKRGRPPKAAEPEPEPEAETEEAAGGAEG